MSARPARSTGLVRAFDTIAAVDRPQVGGKCASLGELRGAGVVVPDGFAVTVAAYEAFRHSGGLRDRLRGLVRDTDPDDPDAVAEASARATALVAATAVPPAVAGEVRSAYRVLCERAARRLGTGAADLPVAVRSSAVAEDGASASFAGQYETYLWVVGADAVVDHIRRCWSSLYTPQAIAYRARLSPEQGFQATLLAVGVQLMVDAEAAGVMFTASPRTGDRSVMAVNATWGLGQAVVAGEVTPDEYWIDKVTGTVRSLTVADKAVAYRPAAGGSGVVAVPVDQQRRRVRCIDDRTVADLVELGRRIEAHYGCPQDIEWALERGADGAAHLRVLQSRAETFFANAAPPRRVTPGYLGIVQSMAQAVAPSRPEAGR